MKAAVSESGIAASSASSSGSGWALVPQVFRDAGGSLPPEWDDIFGPLRRSMVDDLVLVGQCGQSIDARIATSSGHSRYINGEGGLAHLHRLRALVDAVVIGVGTAIQDDPLLTVRRVEGPSPARVVVDPNGRLPPTARVLAADGVRRIVVAAAGTRTQLPDDVEIVHTTTLGPSPAVVRPGGTSCITQAGGRRGQPPSGRWGPGRGNRRRSPAPPGGRSAPTPGRLRARRRCRS